MYFRVESRRSNIPPLSLSLGDYTDPLTFIGTGELKGIFLSCPLA